MSFMAKPLVPGDLFDAAAKLADAADAAIFRIADPVQRWDVLRQQWDGIAELGWPALLVPEAQGGADGSVADLVAVMEGAGRAALCLPLAGVCGVVPALLRRCGPRAEAWLSRIATGEAVICPALSPAAPWAKPRQAPQLRDGVLEGSIAGVETLPAPTHYLLGLPGPRIVLLPADAPGLTITRNESMDGRPSVDLAFGAVRIAPDQVLAEGQGVQAALAAALDLGALLVTAESVAAMGRAIEHTIAYLNTRVQFGTPLGNFQALRHKVVEMFLAAEMLRSLVGYALQETDIEGRVPWREVALAKLRLRDTGRFVANTTIQLHGGMGMTQEMAASRLAKRMLMAEFDFGDSHWQAQRLLEAGHA